MAMAMPGNQPLRQDRAPCELTWATDKCLIAFLSTRAHQVKQACSITYVHSGVPLAPVRGPSLA